MPNSEGSLNLGQITGWEEALVPAGFETLLNVDETTTAAGTSASSQPVTAVAFGGTIDTLCLPKRASVEHIMSKAQQDGATKRFQNRLTFMHVQRETMVAKFWLDPVALQRGGGFRAKELSAIARLVQENRDHFLEKWYEFFGH